MLHNESYKLTESVHKWELGISVFKDILLLHTTL